MPTRIEWRGDRQVRNQMAEYGRRVKLAELRVAQHWAAVLQTYARTHASWTDRTGNARQALRGYTSEDVPAQFAGSDTPYPDPDDLARDTVALYLSHGMDYGLALETKYGGRFAIIMDTLQAHYPKISRMLKRIFGR